MIQPGEVVLSTVQRIEIAKLHLIERQIQFIGFAVVRYRIIAYHYNARCMLQSLGVASPGTGQDIFISMQARHVIAQIKINLLNFFKILDCKLSVYLDLDYPSFCIHGQQLIQHPSLGSAKLGR